MLCVALLAYAHQVRARPSATVPPEIARVFPAPLVTSHLVLPNDDAETDASRTITVLAFVAVIPHSMGNRAPTIVMMIVIAVISMPLIGTVSIPVVAIVMTPGILRMILTGKDPNSIWSEGNRLGVTCMHAGPRKQEPSSKSRHGHIPEILRHGIFSLRTSSLAS